MKLSLVLKLFFLSFLFSLPQFGLLSQDNVDEGKNLFKANCAQCHNRNMKDDLTGPAMGGAEERWAAYPREDMYAWIRNSQKQVSENHPKAIELWAEWGETGGVMNNFPSFTDANIENILAYVNQEYTKAPDVALVQGSGGQAGSSTSSKLMYLFLMVLLGTLALILARVVSNLNHMVRTEEEGYDAPRPTIWDTLTNKSILTFLFFGLLLYGGYVTVNNAIALGRQQGYAPEQPIKFSHETHAGVQQIECKYCHDAARRSKHAGIPPTSTCMNCHKAIVKGSQYGTAEISKIYASIGYNPNKGSYVDPQEYAQYTEDQIKEIFTDWIGDNYLKDNNLDEINKRAQREIDDQWEGIKTSLTNKQKKIIQGPIEWKRIHNLPDHVYFNHSQHVTVGQLECQSCHGAVEEMAVLEQHAPLSMGWCINCHRETEVKGFADNEYYAEAYERYHQALADGEIKKVTVENIGGLECQKCHY